MDRLKGIRIFVEIAEQGSMSAAARVLGVANSVVSKHLHELEQWLDRKLVFRSTRHLRLTQDGLDYLPECRAILNTINRMESRGHSGEATLQGKVRITASLYLGQLLLAPLIAGFCQEHPDVNVEIALSDRYRDLVEEGFDIAFRVSEMPDSDLVSRRLQNIILKTIATPGYIRKNGAPTSPADLPQHRCIIEGNAAGRQRWSFQGNNGRRVGVTVDGALSSSHGEVVKQFCEAGLGIAQLPGFLVDQAIDQGRLVELLPEYAIDTFCLHLLYHKQSTRHPTIAALVDHIYQRFQYSPLSD
ncbi:MAG: LysR family transcriptional regulator [Sedimenticola sp.]|nr:LysR family transcriptional regulator [Sedimenticola sp.]